MRKVPKCQSRNRLSERIAQEPRKARCYAMPPHCPRILLASWMSRCMMVTRFAWIAQRFLYTDYAFKTFIQEAQKQQYFDNTIFVFVGDHGVAGNADAIYPNAWTDQRLSDEHIPLLFYAPKLLLPQTHNEVVSQVDVLPTVAGLIHEPYLNTTLGRDVLHPAKKKQYCIYYSTWWRKDRHCYRLILLYKKHSL